MPKHNTFITAEKRYKSLSWYIEAALKKHQEHNSLDGLWYILSFAYLVWASKKRFALALVQISDEQSELFLM